MDYERSTPNWVNMIMKAFQEGKQIQKLIASGTWEDTDQINFPFKHGEYRVKPNQPAWYRQEENEGYWSISYVAIPDVCVPKADDKLYFGKILIEGRADCMPSLRMDKYIFGILEKPEQPLPVMIAYLSSTLRFMNGDIPTGTEDKMLDEWHDAQAWLDTAEGCLPGTYRPENVPFIIRISPLDSYRKNTAPATYGYWAIPYRNSGVITSTGMLFVLGSPDKVALVGEMKDRQLYKDAAFYRCCLKDELSVNFLVWIQADKDDCTYSAASIPEPKKTQQKSNKSHLRLVT